MDFLIAIIFWLLGVALSVYLYKKTDGLGQPRVVVLLSWAFVLVVLMAYNND